MSNIIIKIHNTMESEIKTQKLNSLPKLYNYCMVESDLSSDLPGSKAHACLTAPWLKMYKLVLKCCIGVSIMGACVYLLGRHGNIALSLNFKNCSKCSDLVI